MEPRFTFLGKGSMLFGRLFGGVILTFITLGLFFPWLVVWMARWLYDGTRFSTPSGDVRFEFTGGGARLLGLMLANGILVVLTLGIYSPWAMVEGIRYATEGSVAHGPDGRPWRLRFEGTGGEAFPIVLKGFLLGIVTFGIYIPWFVCTLARWMASRTRIEKDGVAVGTLAFDGTGGELLVVVLVGVLLTTATFGIYGPWFQVSLWRHFYDRTRVTVNGIAWVPEFTGSGWDWLLTLVVSFLLTFVTLGVYLPWAITRQVRFRLQNSHVLSPQAAANRPYVRPAFPGA